MASFHGLEGSYAFQIHRQTTTSSKIFTESNSLRDFDLDLAEDFAYNFGKYSVDEIEHFIDELHNRRVRNLAFAEDVNSPDIIKERFLEVELNMQVDALKSEMTDSYLFPDEDSFGSNIEIDMSIDGFLMDNGLIAMDLPPFQDTWTSNEKVVEQKKTALWEELANEGILESVAICIFIGFVMFAPGSL